MLCYGEDESNALPGIDPWCVCSLLLLHIVYMLCNQDTDSGEQSLEM